MLFDWLVTGHILEVSPAHAVRGPKYVVKKGKTPFLSADEARTLLDSIDASSLIGLRDRALIGVMVYSFARINAVLSMKVKDYFVQGRRGWVRLHEKGGKLHEVPCHHNLERFLDEYIAAAGVAADENAPLFRAAAGRKRALAAGRLPHDPAQSGSGPHQNEDRQSHVPRDGHHGVFEERRQSGDGAADRRAGLLFPSQGLAVGNIHLGVASLRGCFDCRDHALNMRLYVRPLLLAQNDDRDFSARKTLLAAHVLIGGHKNIKVLSLSRRQRGAGTPWSQRMRINRGYGAGIGGRGRIEAAGGEFQHSDDLFSRHIEPLHDFFYAGPSFKILEDGGYGHARILEDPSAADFAWDAFDSRTL